MGNPKVSVVMPAHNAEAYITHAIDSILGQSFSNFELIVIDDGSHDHTRSIADTFAQRDPRVISLRQEGEANIACALNRGIAESRGIYIARMDADDWSYPTRLERQVEFMEVHRDIVVSGGSIEVCDDALRPLNMRTYRKTDTEIRRRLFRYSPFAHPAVIYRAEVAKDVGGYNPSLSPADDYDFYFRLGLRGLFANLPDVLLKLRTSRGSLSQSQGGRQERLTIYVRLKAATEYGYTFSGADVAYSLLQYASSFVMPPRAKFWLFNRFRSRKSNPN